MQLTNEQKIDKIKQSKKEFFIIDTSNNPKENEYEELKEIAKNVEVKI